MNLLSSGSTEKTQMDTSPKIKEDFHLSSFKAILSKFVIQFAKPIVLICLLFTGPHGKAATITSVAPNRGGTGGGTTIIINGTNCP